MATRSNNVVNGTNECRQCRHVRLNGEQNQATMVTTNSISYASEMAQEKHFVFFFSRRIEKRFLLFVFRFGQTTFYMGFA